MRRRRPAGPLVIPEVILATRNFEVVEAWARSAGVPLSAVLEEWLSVPRLTEPGPW